MVPVVDDYHGTLVADPYRWLEDGASSQIMGPGFGENAIAWIEMGGIVAVPSLRGGGEFGRTWYEAGTLARKQNTFDDFIAAADYLVAERYTSAAKLAISGASNGGLLVASAMTQRPDLFAVAIAEVPMTDALRYDRGRHTPQSGSPKNPEHFPFLYAYSPVHRVAPGTCYPATLITTALNDDRAPAWQAMKFAAALQAAQSCAGRSCCARPRLRRGGRRCARVRGATVRDDDARGQGQMTRGQGPLAAATSSRS